ncbi:MAG: DUF2284 domain-containing protein [Nitrospirae bacterium]|nr:DUF2284 domain-containing protein [Nitrospirota bacterium]
MRKTLPFLNHDVQDAGPQYLEDLATGYWFSELLFAAVEMGLFSLLERVGATDKELARATGASARGFRRFLGALCAVGLVTNDGERFFNTKVSSEYLVSGKALYQGDSILWRRELQTNWRGMADCLKAGGRIDYTVQDDHSGRTLRTAKYIRAMDNVARTKAAELLGFFEGVPLKGRILDAGAGSGAISGAFLERFPHMSATLLDLAGVLDHAREMRGGEACRIRYCPANILEAWPVRRKSFDLVILSNILHAYSEKDLPGILASASDCLKKNGLLLVHDFFLEHRPVKAALSDLNMFINTYNGKVFPGKSVLKELDRLGLCCTDPIPLVTDTAVLFAARERATLRPLRIDAADLLISRILAGGFRKVYRLSAADIRVAGWADLRCRFGCRRYGGPHCPPNSPTPQKTREVLRDFTYALLLEGEPPTRAFQVKVLQAEREAFRAGFHKAFSYWAGPCSLCESCSSDGSCTNTANARPSMEGAGIDVFETARRAGAKLRTLKDKNDYARYFALILLE